MRKIFSRYTFADQLSENSVFALHQLLDVTEVDEIDRRMNAKLINWTIQKVIKLFFVSFIF